MYAAFNLKLSFEDFEDYTDLLHTGQQHKLQLQEETKKELDRFILTEGIIDGSSLSEKWFKTVQSDVFISHSHNDVNLALSLAGWLERVFGLNVFLDEIVWGNADDLLMTIDKKYCWQPENNTYSYEKRNLTTSHVHAMLSTAIQTVMDNTEAIFFLNTRESLPIINNVVREDSKYTLSPWIYQELMATKLLRNRDWKEHRYQAILEHSHQRFDTASTPKIAYKTPIDELCEISTDTLHLWYNNYKKRNALPYNGLFSNNPNHPLNYLYDIVFEKVI